MDSDDLKTAFPLYRKGYLKHHKLNINKLWTNSNSFYSPNSSFITPPFIFRECSQQCGTATPPRPPGCSTYRSSVRHRRFSLALFTTLIMMMLFAGVPNLSGDSEISRFTRHLTVMASVARGLARLPRTSRGSPLSRGLIEADVIR